jgi:hypothetical protein
MDRALVFMTTSMCILDTPIDPAGTSEPPEEVVPPSEHLVAQEVEVYLSTEEAVAETLRIQGLCAKAELDLLNFTGEC